jgi:copper resistance protein D
MLAGMTDPNLLLVACRSVIFGAALLLWGASAYRWRLQPAARAMGFEGLAVLALVAAIVVLLPVQVARIAGGWDDFGDFELVRDVLLYTTPGKAWLFQAAAIAATAVAVATGATRIAVAGTTLIFIAQTLTGHAAASDGLEGLLRQGTHVLHMIAAGAWLGALPYVLRLLPRLHEPDSKAILIRYSGEGHFWVSLVLATGLVATLWIFGTIPTELDIRYQLLWWLKVAVTLVMVGLAIWNRYFLVPLLANEPTALKMLARATRAEIALGLAAVALVAWFGTLEPR